MDQSSLISRFVNNSVDVFVILGLVLFLGISTALKVYKYIKHNTYEVKIIINYIINKLIYIIPIIVAVVVIVWAISSLGKFEGQSAKEWYYDYADVEDRYQKFRNCVEEYDSLDIKSQIEYGGVLYYCE